MYCWDLYGHYCSILPRQYSVQILAILATARASAVCKSLLFNNYLFDTIHLIYYQLVNCLGCQFRLDQVSKQKNKAQVNVCPTLIIQSSRSIQIQELKI